jgi:hypothetical protein
MIENSITVNKRKETRKRLSTDERIKLYERFETALRQFFNSTEFCYDNCFSKEKAIIGWRKSVGHIIGNGNEGCCYPNELYDFSNGLDCFFKEEQNYTSKHKEIFQEMQSKNVKKDFTQTGICKYHTDEGCAIEKLRSPRCNSWICERYQDYLSREFGIDYQGIYYSNNVIKIPLSIVFHKRVNIRGIERAILKIQDATNRIKTHELCQRYKKRIKI